MLRVCLCFFVLLQDVVAFDTSAWGDPIDGPHEAWSVGEYLSLLLGGTRMHEGGCSKRCVVVWVEHGRLQYVVSTRYGRKTRGTHAAMVH